MWRKSMRREVHIQPVERKIAKENANQMLNQSYPNSRIIPYRKMPMKNFLILALLLAPVGAMAAQEGMAGHKAHNMNDKRISLGLSPKMKHHQLINMRAHLAAIQTIIGLLSDEEFEKAAKVAHTKLGLTGEMKQMCDMFENEDFKKIGYAFHSSADELGDALQTKDMKKSLQALHKTTGYCVQCHDKFRQ